MTRALPQVMTLVTPMIVAPKSFGLRLHEGCGDWPMVDEKLYYTRDYMQGNFIPKNLTLPKPKLAPKPLAKASAKASSSGEHAQLFRMVYDCKRSFQAERLSVSHASLLVRTSV